MALGNKYVPWAISYRVAEITRRNANLLPLHALAVSDSGAGARHGADGDAALKLSVEATPPPSAANRCELYGNEVWPLSLI